MTEQARAAVQWPRWPPIAFEEPFPRPWRLRQLARAGVPSLLSALETWHPELAFQDPALLSAGFYDQAVAFQGEESNVALRPTIVLVVDTPEGVAAFVVITYVYLAQILAIRLNAVHPARRTAGLERALAEMAVQVGRAMSGVVAVYQLVEMDDPATCARLEQLGFLLCGIFPNAGRRRMGEAVRYVPKAIYARLLVAPEELLWPPPENLLPRTAALLGLLYQGGATGAGGHDPPRAAEMEPEVAAVLAAPHVDRDAWPDVTRLFGALEPLPGVVVRQMARADIPKLISLLPAWHPLLPASVHSFLLTPEFYESMVAFAGEDQRMENRPALACVGEAEGELVLFFLFSIEEHPSRTLRGELLVVSPAQRHLKLGTRLAPSWKLLARATGADTLLGFTTLAHRYSQLITEKAGFRPFALLPASDCHLVAPGLVKFTFETMYGVSLVPPELSYCPPFSAMSRRVAALARLVLGAGETIP